MGGISKFTMSAVISVPLPLRDVAEKSADVRALTFVTVGSMGSPAFWARWRHNRDVQQQAQEQAQAHSDGRGASAALPALPIFGIPRVSVGAGICGVINGGLRLELTYAVPLLRTPYDQVSPFQLGFGMTIG
jgi:outer membrane protein assembly factor BamA